MLASDALEVARTVAEKYAAVYGQHSLQGCCLLIADEIAQQTGGEVVAGYLTWYGGSCRRSHWWVSLDDLVLDPMGDDLLAMEVLPGRLEEHRSRAIVDSLLPSYERWRIG